MPSFLSFRRGGRALSEVTHPGHTTRSLPEQAHDLWLPGTLCPTWRGKAGEGRATGPPGLWVYGGVTHMGHDLVSLRQCHVRAGHAHWEVRTVQSREGSQVGQG